MSDMRTRPTRRSVDAFLAAVEHAGRREDALALRVIMDRATRAVARMWGDQLFSR